MKHMFLTEQYILVVELNGKGHLQNSHYSILTYHLKLMFANGIHKILVVICYIPLLLKGTLFAVKNEIRYNK